MKWTPYPFSILVRELSDLDNALHSFLSCKFTIEVQQKHPNFPIIAYFAKKSKRCYNKEVRFNIKNREDGRYKMGLIPEVFPRKGIFLWILLIQTEKKR